MKLDTIVIVATQLLSLLFISWLLQNPSQSETQQAFNSFHESSERYLSSDNLDFAGSSTATVETHQPVIKLSEKQLQQVAMHVAERVSQKLPMPQSVIQQEAVEGVTDEQFSQTQEQVTLIVDSGYLDANGVDRLHQQMTRLNRQQTEAVLSSLMTAINSGQLEIEPGVIF